MIFIVLLTWPVFDCSLRWPWEASERFPWEEEISRPAGPNTSTRLDKSRSKSWVPVELKKKHRRSAKLPWHHNIKLSFWSLSSFLFHFFFSSSFFSLSFYPFILLSFRLLVFFLFFFFSFGLLVFLSFCLVVFRLFYFWPKHHSDQ